MANIQFLSTFSTYNSNYDRIYVFRNGLRNIYEGISFVMTAMFVVIFMDQWLKEKNHTSSLLGLGISFLCLLVFGPDSFMIPTMILIIVSLTLLRKKLDIPDQKTTRDIISTNVLLKKWSSNKKHRRFANMTLAQQIITIGLCVLGTMTTRFLPFLVFRENRETPKFIQYVGNFLPSAVFGMLVVYCLRNVNILQGTHGNPEFIFILVIAGLHIWKHQMLISIAGGTICYILLLHFC